jgi:hypothetical protein
MEHTLRAESYKVHEYILPKIWYAVDVINIGCTNKELPEKLVNGRRASIGCTHKDLPKIGKRSTEELLLLKLSEMPVGSGSRNGGGRDREGELSGQPKANGEEESSNSDDDSTSCE